MEIDIQQVVKKLLELAATPVLSKAEHHEARKFMRLLKRAGMSNEEIAELSNGKWSPSTVKGYCKGIKAKSNNQWQSVSDLLKDAISYGMTLDDIGTANSLMDDLTAHKVLLEDVADLVATADDVSLDLNVLVGLAKKHGTLGQVLKALSEYGTLTEIESKIIAGQDNLKAIGIKHSDIIQKIEESEKKLIELEKPLASVSQLADLGFKEAEFSSLASLAKDYGGPKYVLKAVKQYTNYEKILAKYNQCRSQFQSLQGDIENLKVQYAHLKSAVTMCDSLIFKYNYGLDAIASIYSLAKKYAEPIEVMRAVDAMGTIDAVLQKLEELKGNLSERQALLSQLEGKYKEVLDQLESLHARALKVGTEVAKLENKLINNMFVDGILSFMNNPALASYEEHGQLIAMIAHNLEKFVSTHENKFMYPHSIKAGLQSLVKDLGGDM